MYFSDPIARELHGCWSRACNVGAIDESYPKSLPIDFCILEVWDMCGGDPELVYANK